MDFFERQDEARRHTKLLVFYFAAAVLSLVVVINVAGSLILGALVIGPKSELLFWITLGTLAVILAGSAFKTLQLASGGSVVAELLGGRLIDSNTSDTDERKLLNVVEEMSDRLRCACSAGLRHGRRGGNQRICCGTFHKRCGH